MERLVSQVHMSAPHMSPLAGWLEPLTVEALSHQYLYTAAVRDVIDVAIKATFGNYLRLVHRQDHIYTTATIFHTSIILV